MPRLAMTGGDDPGVASMGGPAEPAFAGTSRPGRRPWHATTELDHFLMVTYRVDTDALAAALPEPFVPDVFAFDDGTTGSLVSAVPFLDRDFAFRGMPRITLSCGQVNYRAYVTLDGARGVFFFGTSLDSLLVGVPRALWRMPWHRDHVGAVRCGDLVRFASAGRWGSGALTARITDERFGHLDGFTSAAHTAEVLTHPTIGWYRRLGRGAPRLGRYEIWHPPVEAVRCEPVDAWFTVFERLGLVEPDAVPHSVLYQPSIHFDVLTPPRRVR